MKKVTQKSRRLVMGFLFAVLVIAVIGVGVLLGLQTFSAERDKFVQELNQTVLANNEQKAALALQGRLLDLKRHLKTLIQNKKNPNPMDGLPSYWRTDLLAVAIMERKKTQISVSDHYANLPLLKQKQWDRKLLSQVYQTHPLPLSQFFKAPGTDLLNRSLTYTGPTGAVRVPILTVLVEGSYLDPAWAGQVIAVDFLQDFLIDSFQKAESATFFLIRRNGRLVSHPEVDDVVTYSKSQFPHPIVSRLQRGFSSVYSMGMQMQGKRVFCSIKQTAFRDVLAVSQMNVEVGAIALSLLMKRATRFAIPAGTIFAGLFLAFGGIALRRRQRRRRMVEDAFAGDTDEEDEDSDEPTPLPKTPSPSAGEKKIQAKETTTEPPSAAPASSTPKPSIVEAATDETRLTQLAQTGNIRDIVRGTKVPHPEDHLPHDLESAGAWIGKICAHLPKKGLLRKKFSPPTELLEPPDRLSHFHGGNIEIWAHRASGKSEQDFWAFSAHGPKVLAVLGTVLGDGVCPDHKREITRALQLGLEGELKRHLVSADEVLERLADMFLQSGAGKVFASVTIIESEGADNEITLHTAGHPSPIRMRATPISEMEDSEEEDVDYWVAEGETLGTEPEPSFEGRHFELGEGDSLLVYSQGIFEAKTKRKKHWDEETLATALLRYQGNVPHNVHAELVTLFERTAPKVQTQDATLLVVTRNNAPVTVSRPQAVKTGPLASPSSIIGANAGEKPEQGVPPAVVVGAQQERGSLAGEIAKQEPDSERRQEFLYGELLEEKKSA